MKATRCQVAPAVSTCPISVVFTEFRQMQPRASGQLGSKESAEGPKEKTERMDDVSSRIQARGAVRLSDILEG